MKGWLSTGPNVKWSQKNLCEVWSNSLLFLSGCLFRWLLSFLSNLLIKLSSTLFLVQIPQELIDDFVSGAKNPVMCIHEYCSMKRWPIKFQEAPTQSVFGIQFAAACSMNNKVYPKGNGGTKKEAKIAAARIAMSMILGLSKEINDDEGIIISQGNFSCLYFREIFWFSRIMLIFTDFVWIFSKMWT